MKIEIRRVNKTVAQLHGYLANDCHPIGEGSYGRAYLTPRQTVIKLTFGLDRAYRHWIRTALKYQHNPWMPRILRARRILCVPSYYAVQEERRAGHKWSERAAHAELLLVEMELLDYGNASPGVSTPHPDKLMPWINGKLRFSAKRALKLEGLTPTEHDHEIDRVMADIFDRQLYSSDVRSANVLTRPSDGHLVLTDPICGGN